MILLFVGALLIIAAAIINPAAGQQFYEALRYAHTLPGGTARGWGAGSAFGALGGDYTAIAINPGGLGIYRKPEFFISANLNNTLSRTNFIVDNNEQFKLNFHIPSAGVVYSQLFVDKRGNRSRGNWIAVNYAFGINRMAHHHTKRYYINSSNARSILPALAAELNGLHPDNIRYGAASFESVLAYATYLINPLVHDSLQYNSVTDGIDIGKQVSAITRGRTNELSFAVAANYNDKWYFGGSLSIPIVRYSEDIIYQEYDKNQHTPSFDNFQLNKYLSTRGSGVNFKAGVQYRVSDWMRTGIALHTPSLIRLRDNYYNSIYSELNDSLRFEERSPDGSFRYKLLTPWRTIASVAFLFKQYGFFSVDYEYADYRNARYIFSAEFQSYEVILNRQITAGLGQSHTIRTGLEAAIKDVRLRAGYQFSTSPLAKALQNAIPQDNRMFQSYSAGIGYRTPTFYIDLAYVRTITDNSLMIVSNIVSADRIARNNYIATFGVRF